MACKFILKEERHYCVSECHFSCIALIAMDGSIREILTNLLQARKSRPKVMSPSAVRAYVEYGIDNFSPYRSEKQTKKPESYRVYLGEFKKSSHEASDANAVRMGIPHL